MALIRRLSISDVDDLVSIEHSSGALEPWSRQLFVNEFDSATLWAFGAMEDCKLCGFVLAHAVLDEIEISNIAVHSLYQSKGVGMSLLQHLISLFRDSGGKKVLLDVREGNIPARSLYSKCGFCVVGSRKGYYPNELALLMTLMLDS